MTSTPVAPARPTWVSPYADNARRFKKDVARHQMTVLHDSGVYRHVRFQRPGTGIGYFDLHTSPGQLTIRGDMGTYVFARIYDMFNFFDFTSHGINPGYWGEKLEAIARHEGYMAYSVDKFREWVKTDWRERLDEYTPAQRMTIRAAIDSDILGDDNWGCNIEYREGAMEALNNFDVEGFDYDDLSELDFDDYSFHYLWACHAVQWGIQQYRLAKVAAVEPWTSKRWWTRTEAPFARLASLNAHTSRRWAA